MADDLEVLLAEVDLRCGASGGNWTGKSDLTISDPELCRRLAAELRALCAGMADDRNALLARADHAISVSRRGTDLYGDRRLIRDLAAELRAITSRHHTALNILRRNRDRLSPFLTDEERAVLDQAKDPDHE